MAAAKLKYFIVISRQVVLLWALPTTPLDHDTRLHGGDGDARQANPAPLLYSLQNNLDATQAYGMVPVVVVLTR